MKQIRGMFAGSTVRHYVALIATLLMFGASTATAGDHILPLSELHTQLAHKGAAQQADRTVIERFFSEPRVRDALKGVGMDGDRIVRSAMLLTPEEQASLAQRARTAEEQISGGELKDTQVTLIILCITLFAFTSILVLAFK